MTWQVGQPYRIMRSGAVGWAVAFCLLAEQPMHGYQANAELERRQVRDWAAISRPQIYYSLEKLARADLIAPARDRENSGGPDRAFAGRLANSRNLPIASRAGHPLASISKRITSPL